MCRTKGSPFEQWEVLDIHPDGSATFAAIAISGAVDMTKQSLHELDDLVTLFNKCEQLSTWQRILKNAFCLLTRMSKPACGNRLPGCLFAN